MNINNINNLNTEKNFKSGLSYKTIIKEKFSNPKTTEQLFINKYGIEAFFNNNKSAACANEFCLNIFYNLAKRLNLCFSVPPVINIYKKKNLINADNADNFCLPDTMNVLKNDYPFPGRSLFFKEFKNLKEIDENVELLYDKRKTSSNHFLSPFIHEWLHSIHLDLIYSKLGYGGDCSYLNEIYPAKNTTKNGVSFLKELETKVLSNKENNIIYDVLGKYATLSQNQYLEIFSEAFTKFICESLKDCELIANPLEKLHKTPLEFQKIFKKVCSIEEY